jgi:hypothetical protein
MFDCYYWDGNYEDSLSILLSYFGSSDCINTQRKRERERERERERKP